MNKRIKISLSIYIYTCMKLSMCTDLEPHRGGIREPDGPKLAGAVPPLALEVLRGPGPFRITTDFTSFPIRFVSDVQEVSYLG